MALLPGANCKSCHHFACSQFTSRAPLLEKFSNLYIFSVKLNYFLFLYHSFEIRLN
jgi:hypothetical protein